MPARAEITNPFHKNHTIAKKAADIYFGDQQTERRTNRTGYRSLKQDSSIFHRSSTYLDYLKVKVKKRKEKKLNKKKKKIQHPAVILGSSI